jgi:hypothetical protein
VNSLYLQYEGSHSLDHGVDEESLTISRFVGSIFELYLSDALYGDISN